MANPEWTEPSEWEDDRCPMCGGTGEINALSNQNLIYVANYATCPQCDGTGEMS